MHIIQIEIRNVIALRNPRTVLPPPGDDRLATTRYFFLVFTVRYVRTGWKLYSNGKKCRRARSCEGAPDASGLHQVTGRVCERNERNKKRVHGLQTGGDRAGGPVSLRNGARIGSRTSFGQNFGEPICFRHKAFQYSPARDSDWRVAMACATAWMSWDSG